MHRVALALLVAAAVPAHAQSRVVVDSLVARITHAWGIAPRSNWCAEWSVIYTVIVRREKFAAPVLVGRLRVGYERAEPVTAHAIARGTIFSDADVLLQHTLTWGAPDSELPVALASIIGAEARRTLRDGEPIRAIDVASAPVVFAGDTVTAEIIRDGVRLALVGTALHNASLGARVAIRLNRGRRFAGIATGRNTVRLD
jgi:flagella basal body P-ring formation protein FlgA